MFASTLNSKHNVCAGERAACYPSLSRATVGRGEKGVAASEADSGGLLLLRCPLRRRRRRTGNRLPAFYTM